ncbi:MAG: Gfo/Idh/MocA family oxidoreductase [Sulfolobales archaeon]|nr:Gfo/Idh/MocA family oxidoreductase [Sulfolobales archaeon]
MRAVLVGEGRWGENVARSLKQLELEGMVTLSYVVDVDLSRATEFSKKYGFQSAVSSVSETSGDAYVIATSISTLSKVAREAMEIAHCVFIEKPVAETSREALELLSLAESRGLVHQVGYVSRFDPVVEELKKRVTREEIYGVRFRRLSKRPPRMRSYPVTLDLMTHDIDLAFYLLNQRSAKVVFSLFQIDSSGVPQRAVAGATYDGVNAIFEADGILPVKIREIDVLSEREFLRADLVSRVLTVRGEIGDSRIVIDGEEPLKRELRVFIERCGGKDIEAPSLKDAVAVLELVEEISRAAMKIRESNKNSLSTKNIYLPQHRFYRDELG